MATVYTCFCTDVIHEGHMNIIREAKKYGDVIVGVISDKAMIRFNRFSTISFEERIKLVEKITGNTPILLLDDVLSELDRKRQQFLLDSIGDIQTFITCTGIDDFVNDRFVMNRVFYVENGKVRQMS